jgi:hypothetical protein
MKLQAHIDTEFGGTGYKKFTDLDAARAYLNTQKFIRGLDGAEIKIVRRYITDTKRNLLEEV